MYLNIDWDWDRAQAELERAAALDPQGPDGDLARGDLDVLVHSPIVGKVSNVFDAFWNSEASYSIEQLMGHAADPSALAEYRAKLDAYIQSEHDSPYVVEARQRLAKALEAGDTDFSWGKATLLYDDPSKIARDPANEEGHLMTRFAALQIKPTHEMLIISHKNQKASLGTGVLNRGTH